MIGWSKTDMLAMYPKLNMSLARMRSINFTKYGQMKLVALEAVSFNHNVHKSVYNAPT